jgi:ribosome biogenesis protein Nip4
VNKKAEWLFLCGRNILGASIASNPNRLHSGFVLVQNEQDENLGFGFFKQEGKDLILRNILDKGNYLRMEDKKGKHGKKKH